MTLDEEYMEKALALAEKAASLGEVPVGAIVVDKNGKVIGEGYNRREELQSPIAHAEMLAIEQAAKRLQSRRLTDCILYVTLEPCPMCAGAIINARIPALVFGAREALTGSCGSVIDLFSENYGHRPAVYAGVLGEDCARLLKDFFQGRR